MTAQIKRISRNMKSTAGQLISAAEREFREFGYSGTHTNQIADRAGFAPQTFYRHFSDKMEIFFAVFEQWIYKEIDLLDQSKSVEKIADTIIRHHRKYRIFRRDLRRLTVESEAVGSLRAAYRRKYLEKFNELNPNLQSTPHFEQVAKILFIERIADAMADGELEGVNVPNAQARMLIINALDELLN